MVKAQEPTQLQPPNDYERAIMEPWLTQTARAGQQLEEMGSPWAEYFDDFGGLIAGILHPEEAEA